MKATHVRPSFYLSFPVRNLDEAIEFYTSVLGAEIGRRTDSFADALVFGAQVTLHNDAANVTEPMPRTRHFGATLPWDEWQTVAARLDQSSFIVEGPKASYERQPIEQAKLMITDPSGNLIEIKAYRHPDKVPGSIARA